MNSNSDGYSIEGDTLTIGKVRNTFEFPIKSHLEVEGMIIVVLDVPSGEQHNENVFGVSLMDNHKWQIAKLQFPPGYNQECPFVSLAIYKGDLRLNNWCSKYLIVDPWTGKILAEEDSR